MKNQRKLLLALISSLLLLSASAFAATATGVGHWSSTDDGSPWSGGTVPANGEGDVFFNNGANVTLSNGTVSVGVGTGTSRFYIGNGTNAVAKVNVGGEEGQTALLEINGGTTDIGRSAGSTGYLNIYAGGTVNVTHTAGLRMVRAAKDSSGYLTVDGGNLNVTKFSSGYDGSTSATIKILDGTMTVGDGFELGTGDGSSANLTVSGGDLKINSTNLSMGVGQSANSTATFDLTGGNVTNAFGLIIARGANSTGTANFTGGNYTGTSSTAIARIAFGENSTGTLNVEAGTIKFGGDTLLGTAANATATLNMKGGDLTVGNQLRIADAQGAAGYMVKGVVTVEGGNLSAGEIILSSQRYTSSEMNISGTANVTTTAGGLTIGGGNPYMDATVTMTAGSLTLAGDLIVGGSLRGGTTSLLDVSGGKVLVTGDLVVGRYVTGDAAGARQTAKFTGSSVIDITGAIDMLRGTSNAANHAELIIADQASVTAASINLNASGKLIFQIDDASFTGSLTLGDMGAANLSLNASILIDLSGFTGDEAQLEGLELISYTGAQNTVFEGLVSIAGATSLDFGWVNNVLTLQAIPEPATYAKILGVLALLAVVISRRSRKN